MQHSEKFAIVLTLTGATGAQILTPTKYSSIHHHNKETLFTSCLFYELLFIRLGAYIWVSLITGMEKGLDCNGMEWKDTK